MCNHKVYVRTDKNGTKIYHDYTCDRCEGTGIYIVAIENGVPRPSRVDQGICYKCHGSGKVEKPRIIREYTPKYEAKLAERRAKKHETEATETEVKPIAEESKKPTSYTYKITYKENGILKEKYEYGWNEENAKENFYGYLFSGEVELVNIEKYCENYF